MANQSARRLTRPAVLPILLAVPVGVAWAMEIGTSPAAVSPAQLLSAVILSAGAICIWWVREQRLAAQRGSVRALHTLSEGVIAAGSPHEIAEKLADILPTITGADNVRLYLHNRRVKSLEAVPTTDDPEPMAIPLDALQEGMTGAVARCFKTRESLHIADARRNPLVSSGWTHEQLRSALFVPLTAQNEVLGVLAVGHHRRTGYFSPDEQAAIQHLANQVAAALKLQDQHKVREQMLRGEKLAATGQLISGIAGQLLAPLETIARLSSAASDGRSSPLLERDLKQIAAESRRAAEIVARLVSFARPEDAAAKPVDLHALMHGLMQFREAEWHTWGLRVQNRLALEPATVLGVEGHLEQILLDLLICAEQSAARSTAKNMMVTSSLLGGRIVLEIAYAADQERGALPPGMGLDVARGVIQGHGGEIRCRVQSGSAAFELDLPLAPGTLEGDPGTSPVRSASRSLTLMLVESDATARRQLVGLLAARGHRVVPSAAESSADTARRLRFDAVIWAVRQGGWKWSDFHERLRGSVPSFVLVSDGYDADFARSLAESGGFLLARPVQTADIDRLLAELEAQAPAGA